MCHWHHYLGTSCSWIWIFIQYLLTFCILRMMGHSSVYQQYLVALAQLCSVNRNWADCWHTCLCSGVMVILVVTRCWDMSTMGTTSRYRSTGTQSWPSWCHYSQCLKKLYNRDWNKYQKKIIGIIPGNTAMSISVTWTGPAGYCRPGHDHYCYQIWPGTQTLGSSCERSESVQWGGATASHG